MSDAGPTSDLAAFAASLSFDDIPPEVIAHAKRSVLDTLGCGLQGSTLEWSRIARTVADAESNGGGSTVWGTRRRASRSTAAWLNATAAHGFELDDVHMGSMIHPGSLTVSVAMAMGEPLQMDGRSLLTAVVAGCEVGARVGRAVGTPHFRAGYHPQGTIGVFAAGAAAASAGGLDRHATRQALGIAGSHASGLMGAQRGAMVKRLHSGHAAQSGVVAALLAAEGFTGTEDVLEAEFGGFCSTMGGGSVQVERLTDGLGDRWETLEVAFKPYPSCAAAQASIEAARILRSQHDLDARAVDRITITTSEHVRVHSGWAYQPQGITAAQMSIGYGVAQMITSGSLTAEHFTEHRIADPQVVALARRVQVLSEPAIDALGPDRRYVADVVVHTADGRTLSHHIEDRPGNSTNPMTDEQLAAKFVGSAAPVIGSASADAIRAAVASLERLTKISAVLDLLACPAPPIRPRFRRSEPAAAGDSP